MVTKEAIVVAPPQGVLHKKQITSAFTKSRGVPLTLSPTFNKSQLFTLQQRHSVRFTGRSQWASSLEALGFWVWGMELGSL